MIDSHLHLWDLGPGAGGGMGPDGGGPCAAVGHLTGGPRPYAWLGPQHGGLFRSYGEEEARETLEAAGVEGVVLVQADDTVADTESMLAVADRDPWALGVVGWIPLEKPAHAEKELQRFLLSPAFVGVRHLIHDDPRDNFLELPAVRDSLRMVARYGLVFDVPDAFPRHLGHAVRLARALPELTVVLDHLGKPPLADAAAMDVWRSQFRALAELPNTVAKVSGLHLPGVPYTAAGLRPLWDEALEAFGPGRLMIGGDWPVSTLGAPYGRTLEVLLELVAELSTAEREDFLEHTAARTYGLSRELAENTPKFRF
ncbi:amidohydrolase family protein [Arthrobacter bambusae]|uniref:amidohydrolase family protein n=1 Tax=Arthrobacter bambusae TaxID=1338426 RepID=UPI00277E6D33|nr:amidohydrolase family protein [Arthrobacter bambusae]MDQ0030065.1 L-fuconolactonase [Arthrobacter bambusae]MDQ0097416.1 L-fuconolactonase [Arthrobacter bambusae]